MCTLLRRVRFALLCGIVAQRVGIELAIERSSVRLPVEHCCVTTLGKLFTPLRLYYRTVQFATDVKTGNVTADCVRGVVYRSWEVPWVQSVGPMECHGIGNRYASFMGMDGNDLVGMGGKGNSTLSHFPPTDKPTSQTDGRGNESF